MKRKHFGALYAFVLVVVYFGALSLADVNNKDGVAVTTSTTFDGVTVSSADGQTVASGSSDSPGSGEVVSWYDFDDTITGEGNDDSHSTRDLEEDNTPSYNTTGPEYGVADETGDKAWSQSNLSAATNWDGSGDWTIVTRVRYPTAPSPDGYVFEGGSRMNLHLDSATGNIFFEIGNVVTDTGIAPTTNTWIFIIMEHDDTANEGKIYINQVATADDTITPSVHPTGSDDITFGSSNGTNVEDIEFDYFVVFDDLLTSDEKTWFYNSGNSRSYGDL